jgi:hypothetical protein
MKKIILFTLSSCIGYFTASAQISNTVYQPLFSEATFNAKGIDYNKTIGTISGEASVADLGAGIYQLPIAIPPGTNGAQPNIVINYNSQGGN